MAAYMITYELPHANRNEAIKRFVSGEAMQDPAGAKTTARWHAVGGKIGWAVVETDDPSVMTAWLLQWTDIIDYDITPVVSDEGLGEALGKAGLG